MIEFFGGAGLEYTVSKIPSQSSKSIWENNKNLKIWKKQRCQRQIKIHCGINATMCPNSG